MDGGFFRKLGTSLYVMSLAQYLCVLTQHSLESSSSRTSNMVVFLTGFPLSWSSSSGNELMNGELRILTSSPLGPLTPFVSPTDRFVPEIR